MPANRKPSSSSAGHLDDIDWQLLDALQADARLTNAELSRRVNLSAPAVAERVRRLEHGGAIIGYRTMLDPAALGYPLTVIVRVRPAPLQLHKIAALAPRVPEVVACHRVTGEDCYVLTAHVRDIAHLERVIDRFALLGQTTSSLVQSSPVPLRGLTLEPDGQDAVDLPGL